MSTSIGACAMTEMPRQLIDRRAFDGDLPRERTPTGRTRLAGSSTPPGPGDYSGTGRAKRAGDQRQPSRTPTVRRRCTRLPDGRSVHPASISCDDQRRESAMRASSTRTGARPGTGDRVPVPLTPLIGRNAAELADARRFLLHPHKAAHTHRRARGFVVFARSFTDRHAPVEQRAPFTRQSCPCRHRWAPPNGGRR